MSVIEVKFYTAMKKMIEDNFIQKINEASDIIKQKVETNLNLDDLNGHYLITPEVRSRLVEELHTSKAAIGRLLNRASSLYQSFDINHNRLRTFKLLPIDNKYINIKFNFEDKNYDLIYDKSTGYINISKFSSQFTVPFKLWRKEFNGNEAIKWLSDKYRIQTEESPSIGVIYEIEENGYSGYYIHSELFLSYVVLVSPVLNLIMARLLQSLKICKTTFYFSKNKPIVAQRKRKTVESSPLISAESSSSNESLSNESQGSKRRRTSEPDDSPNDIDIREPIDRSSSNDQIEDLESKLSNLDIDGNNIEKVSKKIEDLSLDSDDDLIFDTSMPTTRVIRKQHKEVSSSAASTATNMEWNVAQSTKELSKPTTKPKVKVVGRSKINYIEDDDDNDVIRTSNGNTLKCKKTLFKKPLFK